MRKVLAITVALMIAAVILSPAMGYTIQSAGNQSYSIQSEKVNYTITAGTPAHALTLENIPGKTTPGAAVQATRVPYSFKSGGAVPYSMKLEGGAETATPAVTTPAVTEQPVNATPVAETPVVEAPVNETPAVEAPVVEAPVNETPTAPVEAATFSIMGKVFNDVEGNGVLDNNETGLAGWTVSLEQPAGTIIANQTTAEDGSYAFTGLSAGEYSVSEVVQMGWTPVSPADGRYAVTVTNMTIANLDFANMMTPAPVEAPPVEAAPENATVPENTTPA